LLRFAVLLRLCFQRVPTTEQIVPSSVRARFSVKTPVRQACRAGCLWPGWEPGGAQSRIDKPKTCRYTSTTSCCLCCQALRPGCLLWPDAACGVPMDREVRAALPPLLPGRSAGMCGGFLYSPLIFVLVALLFYAFLFLLQAFGVVSLFV